MKNVVSKTFLLLLLSSFFISCEESKYRKAKTLLSRGELLVSIQKSDSALILYREAIELIKDSHEKQLLGELHTRTGDLFLSGNMYEPARKAYKNGLKCTMNLEDKTNASKSLRGMGKSFLFNFQPDSAITYFLQAEKLLNHIKNHDEISHVYDNLSGFYLMEKEYKKSLYYNQKAIHYTSDSLNLYRNWLVKATLFSRTGQYDSADYYFSLSHHSPNIYTRAGSYLKHAELCKATSNGNSCKYLNIYQILKDSIETMGIQNEMKTIQEQYTFDKIIEKETKKRAFCIIGILLPGLLLIFFLTFRFKNRLAAMTRIKEHYFNKHKEDNDTIISLHTDMSKLLEELEKAQIEQIELKKQTILLNRLTEIQRTIITNVVKSGNNCSSHFIKTKFYLETKNRLSNDTVLSVKDQNIIYKTTLSAYKPFVLYLSVFMKTPMEDCYLCCLSLSCFTTKECAILRGVSSEAIRSQRARIKKKCMESFSNVELFELIFQ